MKAIAGTGFIVAFGNRNDRFHGWAVQVAQRITEPGGRNTCPVLWPAIR